MGLDLINSMCSPLLNSNSAILSRIFCLSISIKNSPGQIRTAVRAFLYEISHTRGPYASSSLNELRRLTATLRGCITSEKVYALKRLLIYAACDSASCVFSCLASFPASLPSLAFTFFWPLFFFRCWSFAFAASFLSRSTMLISLISQTLRG